MSFAVLWIGFALAVGMLAGKRGRGSGNWFVLALLISPLLAVIFLFIADDLSKAGPSTKTHMQCPACAEMVLREATKCKHCGGAVTPTRYDPALEVRATAKQEVLVGASILAAFILGIVWLINK